MYVHTVNYIYIHFLVNQCCSLTCVNEQWLPIMKNCKNDLLKNRSHLF